MKSISDCYAKRFSSSSNRTNSSTYAHIHRGPPSNRTRFTKTVSFFCETCQAQTSRIQKESVGFLQPLCVTHIPGLFSKHKTSKYE